jgi:hypothetical protein
MGTPNLKSEHMSKVGNIKRLFRIINDGLMRVESVPHAERVRTLQSLREVNEELCDYVVDMVKYVEKSKNETRKVRRVVSNVPSISEE